MTPETPRRTRRLWNGYALAMLHAAIAAVARYALEPQLNGIQPFAFFYIAVGLTAWLAGTGPALVGMFVGLAIGSFLFIEPRLSFAVQTLLPVGVYLVVSLSFIALMSRARRGERIAQENTRRIQQSDAELSRQHALLEGLAESVLDGILIVGPDGRVLYLNRRFREIWRFPDAVISEASDAAALTWAETQVPDPAAFRARIAAVYAQPDRSMRDEMELKDGRIFDRYGAPVVNNGVHHGWVWTFRDVSVQKRAESALRDSEERTRALSEATFDALMLHENGTVLEVNGQFETMFGYSAAEVLGKPALPAMMNEQSGSEAMQHIRAGDEGPYVAVCRRKDGSTFVAEIRAKNLIYKGRRVRVASAHDITARCEAEAALRESEGRFHQAFADAPIGMVLTDLNGRLLHVNRAYCGITGYPEAELLDPELDFLKLTHPEDVPANRAAYQRLLAGEIPAFFVEKRYRRKNGEIVWVRASASLRKDRGGRPFQIIGLVEDISDKKRAEEALRESEERFRAVADNIPQLAWMTSASGEILWLNHRWRDYTGTTLEFMRREGWQAVHHPDHPTSVVEGWRRALQTGENWEDTFPLRGRDGSYRWFLSRAFPIRDAEGRIQRWFGTNTDVTQLRETEAALKQAHEELQRHAQVLEATVAERTARLRETVEELEGFSYSLSHDMRAPLRAMKGFSQMLEAEFGAQLGERGGLYLQRISRAAGRLDQLIQDVLAYSRIVREEIQLEPIDLEKLAHELIDENPALQPPKAVVTIGSPLHPVLGHEAYLMQVLSNLVYNAVKFVAPGVEPRVHVWTEPRGEHVRLSVRDNGIGIPPGAQVRIFRMFERFHGEHAYEGTGIGLAIARKAVERLGGWMGVESEPGRGSVFWVQLKQAEAA